MTDSAAPQGSPVSADAISACVLDAFDQLPEKRKPRQRGHGIGEWVPLSGIVLSKDGQLACVALGTGMKCLPSAKVPLANGTVLHDWHAEVVAIRAFNRFLVDECRGLASDPPMPSVFVRRVSEHDTIGPASQPFAIQDGVEVHMYCSEAPCGDASMELVMDAQDDPTPWTEPPPPVPMPKRSSENYELGDGTVLLRGRSNFSYLGAVRLKPSRTDAPPTLSKSCTDKLAIAEVTSLLSWLPSLLLDPRNVYLSSLVIPKSQFVETAATRAFGEAGRMSGAALLLEQTPGFAKSCYSFRPFEVKTTSREFRYSRRGIPPDHKPVPSNLSAVYTPHFQETLVGGVLQGRKQFDPRGASMISRRSMWAAVTDVASVLREPGLMATLGAESYMKLKAEFLAPRNAVKTAIKKEILKGWVSNERDDRFTLMGVQST